MRIVLAPFFWLGRVLLWILFFPIGVWRSLRHHRKKGERRVYDKVKRDMEQERGSTE